MEEMMHPISLAQMGIVPERKLCHLSGGSKSTRRKKGKGRTERESFGKGVRREVCLVVDPVSTLSRVA